MKKNLITVLKKLLAAFGGEETNSNNAVEVIDKIADSVEQGSGGSGGGALICTDTNGTLDKTMNEIQTAYISGRTVIIHVFASPSYFSVARLVCVYYDDRNKNYTGYLQSDGNDIKYSVSEATEEAALDAYPIMQQPNNEH